MEIRWYISHKRPLCSISLFQRRISVAFRWLSNCEGLNDTFPCGGGVGGCRSSQQRIWNFAVSLALPLDACELVTCRFPVALYDRLIWVDMEWGEEEFLVLSASVALDSGSPFVCSMSPGYSSSPPRVRRFDGNERTSYRDAPYRKDQCSYRQDYLCNNCKQPGHFARDCPNAAVCNNCGLPGHIAAVCTGETLCWNCKESGHVASQCTNKPICHVCSNAGHLTRDCPGLGISALDTRLCSNCYKPGHIAADCTNEKACNNCHKAGHVARDCPNEPVCNNCNMSGHMACQCPKARLASEIQGGPFHDIICRLCNQPGHSNRDCVGIVICNNCGGRGHLAYECPSGWMIDGGFGILRY